MLLLRIKTPETLAKFCPCLQRSSRQREVPNKEQRKRKKEEKAKHTMDQLVELATRLGLLAMFRPRRQLERHITVRSLAVTLQLGRMIRNDLPEQTVLNWQRNITLVSVLGILVARLAALAFWASQFGASKAVLYDYSAADRIAIRPVTIYQFDTFSLPID